MRVFVLFLEAVQEVVTDGRLMLRTPVEKALEVLARLEPPPHRARQIACPTPEHEDNKPSAMLYPDGGWKCFSCDAYGSALDLYAMRKGLTIRQALNRLGCFGDDYTPPRPKPQPRRTYMPESVKEILLSSGEYAERWEVAKLLALQSPEQAKLDVLGAWDSLERFDIPEVLKLASMVRGVALFRHADPAKAHEPRERALAVRRLLRELQETR